MMTMALLLVHSVAVPEDARAAVKAAYDAPVSDRQAMLETAAKVLHRSTELECHEARELLDLPCGGC